MVFSYVLSTFIQSDDMLKTIFERSKSFLKEGGVVLITDFCYYKMECDGFWGGMCTELDGEEPPKEFGTFIFRTDRSPDQAYKIFNIPDYVMAKNGRLGGFNDI